MLQQELFFDQEHAMFLECSTRARGVNMGVEELPDKLYINWRSACAFSEDSNTESNDTMMRNENYREISKVGIHTKNT